MHLHWVIEEKEEDLIPISLLIYSLSRFSLNSSTGQKLESMILESHYHFMQLKEGI